MIKFRLVLFLSIIGFCTGSAQTEEAKIPWEEGRSLSWEDFKAAPSASSPFRANTNSGITFSYSYTEKDGNRELNYVVQSFFYPQRSWKKEIANKDFLLAHEQLHFDITELHARMFRKELAEVKPGKNIKKELLALYQKYEKAQTAMQEQFDAETDHSKIMEAEMKWRQYVKSELENYKAYAN